MSPQECIDFLVERVGHERDNATAEVRRSFAGGYGALYQAAYMLGGLQIRALHKELVDSGKMTVRAFHDAILQENRIPIEMVRASLSKQELTRDYAPGWKRGRPGSGGWRSGGRQPDDARMAAEPTERPMTTRRVVCAVRRVKESS